jgi:hypothetical protein
MRLPFNIFYQDALTLFDQAALASNGEEWEDSALLLKKYSDLLSFCGWSDLEFNNYLLSRINQNW